MKCEPENMSTEKEAQNTTKKDVGKAVNTGANAAHSILRRIQMAIIHEQVCIYAIKDLKVHMLFLNSLVSRNKGLRY